MTGKGLLRGPGPAWTSAGPAPLRLVFLPLSPTISKYTRGSGRSGGRRRGAEGGQGAPGSQRLRPCARHCSLPEPASVEWANRRRSRASRAAPMPTAAGRCAPGPHHHGDPLSPHGPAEAPRPTGGTGPCCAARACGAGGARHTRPSWPSGALEPAAPRTHSRNSRQLPPPTSLRGPPPRTLAREGDAGPSGLRSPRTRLAPARLTHLRLLRGRAAAGGPPVGSGAAHAGGTPGLILGLCAPEAAPGQRGPGACGQARREGRLGV